MTKIHSIAILFCCASLVACRKNNETTVVSAPPSCDERIETAVNGKCVLRPEYTRVGGFVLAKDGPYWISTQSAECIDTVAMAFRVDTLSLDRYIFSLTFEEYGGNSNGTTDISGENPEPNYFPDAVRGDSVHFTLRTRCFDWINPQSQPSAEFFGRFDARRTTLTGHLAYRDGYGGPFNGRVFQNFVFRKL